MSNESYIPSLIGAIIDNCTIKCGQKYHHHNNAGTIICSENEFIYFTLHIQLSLHTRAAFAAKYSPS